MGLMFCHCNCTPGVGEHDWTFVTAATSQICYSATVGFLQNIFEHSSNKLEADIADFYVQP